MISTSILWLSDWGSLSPPGNSREIHLWAMADRKWKLPILPQERAAIVNGDEWAPCLGQKPKDISSSECTQKVQDHKLKVGNCKEQSLIQRSFSPVHFEFSKMTFLILPCHNRSYHFPQHQAKVNQTGICIQLCYELALGPWAEQTLLWVCSHTEQ